MDTLGYVVVDTGKYSVFCLLWGRLAGGKIRARQPARSGSPHDDERMEP
jgi:hypothetical protein